MWQHKCSDGNSPLPSLILNGKREAISALSKALKMPLLSRACAERCAPTRQRLRQSLWYFQKAVEHFTQVFEIIHALTLAVIDRVCMPLNIMDLMLLFNLCQFNILTMIRSP